MRPHTNVFPNYYTGDPEGSVVNTAVARVIITVLGIWKLASYDWASIPQWPVYANDYYLLIVPEWIQPYLVFEKYLALIGLVLFGLGVSHRYVMPTTAILIAHLGAARYTLDPSGGSQALFTLVYFLAFLRCTGRRTCYRTMEFGPPGTVKSNTEVSGVLRGNEHARRTPE